MAIIKEVELAGKNKQNIALQHATTVSTLPMFLKAKQKMFAQLEIQEIVPPRKCVCLRHSNIWTKQFTHNLFRYEPKH